jgi:hypothetical protein
MSPSLEGRARRAYRPMDGLFPNDPHAAPPQSGRRLMCSCTPGPTSAWCHFSESGPSPPWCSTTCRERWIGQFRRLSPCSSP